MPLVIGHEVVERYDPTSHLNAGIYVSVFLLVSTFFWWMILNVKSRPPKVCYCFLQRQYKTLMFQFLAIGFLFQIVTRAGWLSIPFGIGVIVHTGIAVSGSLACFVLGYLWGSKRLDQRERFLFLALLLPTCFFQSLGLILFIPVAKLLVAICAITLGARKFPIIFAAIVLPMFIVLHCGKFEMRAKYWFGNQQTRFGILDSPKILYEWYGYSFAYLFSTKELEDFEPIPLDGVKKEERRFIERVSIMHKFLEVQDRAGKDVPYMNGATYFVIPRALVPRALNPGKVSPHEAMYLINITYGHQTREDTRSTHIAWGMLSEAWANFGFWGLVIMGALIGSLLGALTIYTRDLPLSSFRGSFAALVCTSTIHAGSTTLAILTTTVFHSYVIILAVAAVLMHPREYETIRVKTSN